MNLKTAVKNGEELVEWIGADGSAVASGMRARTCSST